MPKAGAGAPLDLQDERSKGGHPLQFGRGKCSLVEGEKQLAANAQEPTGTHR